MLSKISLILAAAAAVSAAPVEQRAADTIQVPVKQVNNVKSALGLVQAGQSRLNKINNGGSKLRARQSSGTVTNEDVSYIASVSIGGSAYDLIVDTGSSNTWCGAQGSCEPSGSGQSTGESVEVSYGSGSFSGTEYTDEVSFGGLTVSSQSVGAASSSSGFNTVDGIIGFGPVDLTQNTVSGQSEVPTFMDNLYSQGSISTEVLGVSFRPESGSDDDDSNGELTLGGTDSSRYSGSITYFPKTSSGSATPYWGTSVSAFKYGGSTLGSTSGAIVDTGTTLIYIPTSAYDNFLSATGGSTDRNSGLASFSSKPTSNFAIVINGNTYSLTPSQYLIPSDQYSNFGITNSGKYYSWINDGGSSGVDCIIGQKFLENYYSVFDTTNSRIGFATAA